MDVHDREDLLRDASGMDPRIELRLAALEHSIFCGFRNHTALSLYWGQDNVVQFNSLGEIRRAFWENRMLASYNHRLHSLHRDTTSKRVRLHRELMADGTVREFETFWYQAVATLTESLSSKSCQIVGQFPDDVDVLAQVELWLQRKAAPLRYAKHPGIG